MAEAAAALNSLLVCCIISPTSPLNAHKETYQGENEFLWYPIF